MLECNLTNVLCSHYKKWFNKLLQLLLKQIKNMYSKQIQRNYKKANGNCKWNIQQRIFKNIFSKTTKFQKQRIFKTRWMSSIVEKRWEVRISALEDRTIEFILSKQQRETKVLGSCEKIKDPTFISLESQRESTEKWS